MKLIGLYDSPYVRRVAVTMRLYAFEFEQVLPDEVPQGRYPNLDKLSAYCESLPAFVDIPLE